jgi:site-specific recombinase XerD
MENEMSVVPSAEEVAQWQALAQAAWSYARASKAPATLRAYRADLADFTLWCVEHDRVSRPAAPGTICLYLTHLAASGARVATIARRLSAIGQAELAAGITPSPTLDWQVRATLAGIRRTHGLPPEQKAVVLTQELRQLLAVTSEETLAGLRDRALLLLGFAGGFRRSDLVALDVEDLTETEEGLQVTIRSDGADPGEESRVLGVPSGQHPETCPVRALRAWREAAAITSGPLFRGVTRHGTLREGRLSAQSVALIIKRAAERAGLDPAHYAGHSLRSGLATAAAAGGASERAIMRQTGHKSVLSIRRYTDVSTLFNDNAVAYVGL